MPEPLAEQTALIDEKKYEKHDSAAGFLVKLAAREFDVYLSEETEARWKQALRAVYEADDVLDRNDPAEKASMMDVLHAFRKNQAYESYGISPDAVREAQKLKDMLPEAQAQAFVAKCLQIITVSEKLRTIESPRDYARERMFEGQLLVTAMTQIVIPEDTEQPRYKDFLRFWPTGQTAHQPLSQSMPTI